MTVIGDPEAYALAYESGLRAVAEQGATLKETRDRAGALMSAAAVAGGLAAGLAFNADRTSHITLVGIVGAVLAMAGFVSVTLTTVLIWRPAEGRFVHDSGVIIGSYVERDPPAHLAEVQRELALWLGRQAESNRVMLETQLKTFTWGLGALLVEVLGVVIALGDVAHG